MFPAPGRSTCVEVTQTLGSGRGQSRGPQPGQGQRKSQPFSGPRGLVLACVLGEAAQGRDPVPQPQPPPRTALSQLLILSLRPLGDKFSHIQVGSIPSLAKTPDGGEGGGGRRGW